MEEAVKLSPVKMRNSNRRLDDKCITGAGRVCWTAARRIDLSEIYKYPPLLIKVAQKDSQEFVPQSPTGKAFGNKPEKRKHNIHYRTPFKIAKR